MEEGFELSTVFNNKKLSFHARFLKYGHGYKLEVNVEGIKVLFEPDEERNWRAVIAYENMQANKKPNIELLQAITLSIEKILK